MILAMFDPLERQTTRWGGIIGSPKPSMGYVDGLRTLIKAARLEFEHKRDVPKSMHARSSTYFEVVRAE